MVTIVKGSYFGCNFVIVSRYPKHSPTPTKKKRKKREAKAPFIFGHETEMIAY